MTSHDRDRFFAREGKWDAQTMHLLSFANGYHQKGAVQNRGEASAFELAHQSLTMLVLPFWHLAFLSITPSCLVKKIYRESSLQELSNSMHFISIQPTLGMLKSISLDVKRVHDTDMQGSP